MELFRWCATSGNISFGHDVVREILQQNPVKPIWDAIFVWAAATGKGVDEIGRMIDIMESANPSTSDSPERRQADIATINALVEYAISKEDPYMAERFIALGRERGIEPDAKTYGLQIDYRLSVGDIDGALTSYKNLQSTDVSSQEDVPTVNKLIVALRSSRRHDFDTIMNVAADLSDRRARFEPQTVTTLALLHLDRDEVHDVTDLLNTHAYHFSSAERAGIRDALVAYCLDPQTPLARTWDAYTILREIFDELPRQPRTQLMSMFFRRERPDIAVHVFNHMRSHSREDTIPTIDTYVTAFMSAARLKDLESLELIHNQLKLDFNIHVSTHLRNALIIAYTACGKPRKALGFWDDIVASREGPSYNSIHVAFRACEHAHHGDIKAKEIWEKLRKMNIELDRTLWGSYIAAVAGQGDMRHAAEILAAADEEGELDVDEHVLGSLFMGTPNAVKQRDVEAWARDKYPQVWASLMEKGVEELENEARVLKGIDRSVAP
ncbi:hypothetical protein EJ03DRAFT_264560 [Teratosphaeria nubilosa]|uniref:TPR-like protein n=1 Tax=Teratosphaeria nubilosa TaxID=161662 RepID=A0A6G1LLB1_9PEZI|nr:hypothetical protein EJ03DRAFT_264560 [Teratosphaeria nubilosa]